MARHCKCNIVTTHFGMGCIKSKKKNEDLETSKKPELQDLYSFFTKLSDGKTQGCQKSDLEVTWNYIDKRLLSRLLSYYFLHNKTVTFEEFVKPPISFVKGTHEDKVDLVIKFSKGSKEGAPSLTEFIQYVSSVVSTNFKILMYLQIEEYMVWSKVLTPIDDSKIDEYAAWLCDDLHPANNNSLEFEELSNWYYKASIFEELQCHVFQQLYQMINNTEYECSLPLCIDPEHILKKDKSILDAVSISLIQSYIFNAEKDYWRILYSSAIHGISLLSLVEHIQKKGPTLLVIKDNVNYIFGGYASESWEPEVAKFCGNPTGFLYTIQPKMKVYRASGRSTNYQYLAFRKRNVPNGMGFGGREGHFTLWIDQDGMSGESNTKCSTYLGVPRLSLHKHFIIVEMEVWGFGSIGQLVPGTRPQRVRSILDTEGIFDPTAVFGLTGKPYHSENFQEVGKYIKEQHYVDIINMEEYAVAQSCESILFDPVPHHAPCPILAPSKCPECNLSSESTSALDYAIDHSKLELQLQALENYRSTRDEKPTTSAAYARFKGFRIPSATSEESVQSKKGPSTETIDSIAAMKKNKQEIDKLSTTHEDD